MTSSSNKVKKKPFSVKKIGEFLGQNYLLVTIILLFIVGSFLSDKFFTTRNILNVLLQNSMMTIISMGMLFVIITGGIDLSVGSVVALSGCLVAGFIQGGMSTLLSVFLVLLLMSVIGISAGVLVAFGKIAPFIVTLAMMTIVRGLAYIYQVGADRRIDGSELVTSINSNVGGVIPLPIIIMVIVVTLAWFILEKTTFGRSVYAIGGNMETARLAGINVKTNIILVYTISSVLAAVSGIILTGRLSMGTALVGAGYELDAIAAVVVGGAALSGGNGTAVNTLIGALIIGVLANILNLMGVAAYPQMIIKGLIIIVAVLVKRD